MTKHARHKLGSEPVVGVEPMTYRLHAGTRTAVVDVVPD